MWLMERKVDMAFPPTRVAYYTGAIYKERKKIRKLFFGEKIIWGERQKHIYKVIMRKMKVPNQEKKSKALIINAFYSGHELCDKVKHIP